MINAYQLAGQVNARQMGREWHAFCPAHRGKSRSLHFRDGDDGRILMLCRAGCSTADVLRALGLSFSDISPNATHRPRPKSALERAVEEQVRDCRRRLTKRERVLDVAVLVCNHETLNAAFARALALAVEKQEIVQIVLEPTR